jgi:hypothetical protein
MLKKSKSKSWKWTKEAVIADAKQFQTKAEWRKHSSAYAMATRQGWLEEATAHMTVLWKQKWTKDAVLEDALKFTSRSEWENKSNGAVASAKYGIEIIDGRLTSIKGYESVNDEIMFDFNLGC